MMGEGSPISAAFYDRLHAHLEHPNEFRKLLDGLIQKDIWADTASRLMDSGADITKLGQDLKGLAKQEGLSPFLVDYALLFWTAKPLWDAYRLRNIPEWIFWDSIRDLRSKWRECREMYEQWGTFVFEWYPSFYRLTRFGLGRLQFDVSVFGGETWQFGRFKLQKGDPLYGCHIPSGMPLRREDVLDSYRKAAAFFGRKLLAVECVSWLMYPPLAEILLPESGIVQFQRDFQIIKVEESKAFGDAWRVFGPAASQPPSMWPTDSTLRKAITTRVCTGLPMGIGTGILLFDGEHVLTRN